MPDDVVQCLRTTRVAGQPLNISVHEGGDMPIDDRERPRKPRGKPSGDKAGRKPVKAKPRVSNAAAKPANAKPSSAKPTLTGTREKRGKV